VKTDTETAIVIFRRIPGKDGEVIALFPCLPGTNDPNTCLSYMHTGQHGGATASQHGWPRATPEEYAPLKKELEAIGYVLDVKVQSCPAYRMRRKEALSV